MKGKRHEPSPYYPPGYFLEKNLKWACEILRQLPNLPNGKGKDELAQIAQSIVEGTHPYKGSFHSRIEMLQGLYDRLLTANLSSDEDRFLRSIFEALEEIFLQLNEDRLLSLFLTKCANLRAEVYASERLRTKNGVVRRPM